MGEVLAFPETMVRQWESLAVGIRSAMLSTGDSPADVEHVLEVLRPIYLRAARPIPIPEGASGDDAVRFVGEWIGAMVTDMLMAIAVREIELRDAGLRP